MAKLNVPLPSKPTQEVPETPAPSPAAKQHLAEATPKVKKTRKKRRDPNDPTFVRSFTWRKAYDVQLQAIADKIALEAGNSSPNVTPLIISALIKVYDLKS